MAALDPDLELMLHYEPPETRVRLMIEWAGNEPDLVAKGVSLLAPIEDGTALAEVTLTTVAKMRGDAEIGYIELLPVFGQELNVSRTVINAPAKLIGGGYNGPSGKGVTIGIVEYDFDVFHRSLRNTDGSSRFLWLWDMNASGKTAKIDDLKAPEGFGTGVLYSKADIDLALSKPAAGEDKKTTKRRQKLFGNLMMLRGGGHGTGVASIAAGSGRLSTGADSGNLGIAPEADLVGVAVRSLHDWATGLRFLRKKLQGKPSVMNLSAGEHHGPHLPGGRVEKWFEALIDKSGIALVKSAGNGGGLGGHATGTVKKNTTATLQLQMTSNAAQLKKRIRVQIWYGYGGASPKLGATITPPGGATAYDIPYDGICTAPPSQIRASNRKRPDQLGLSAIVLWLKPSVGLWTIRLRAPEDKDVKWHAWISWGASRTRTVRFTGNSVVSDASSITVPAAVPNMVTVASFITKDQTGNSTPDHKIAPSSARGPAADGVAAAITIAAPGEYIRAATPPDPLAHGQPPGTTDRYELLAGTSFAAPHVTGAIALMLEKNPNLKPSQIVSILRTDNPSEKLDKNSWGSGRLDIARLLSLVPSP